MLRSWFKNNRLSLFFFHLRITVWESDDTLCLVLHKFRATSFQAGRREPWPGNKDEVSDRPQPKMII